MKCKVLLLTTLVLNLVSCGGSGGGSSPVKSSSLDSSSSSANPASSNAGLNSSATSSGSSSSKPQYSDSVVSNVHFFVGDDGVHGKELWKTDGTEAGTVMVKDINVSTDSTPKQLTYSNGIIYFHADDGVHGRELWRSDGTDMGTRMVKDINTVVEPLNPMTDAFWSDFFITSVNNLLYFVANDGVHGYELWKSDGTAEGTLLVKDIVPDAVGMGPDRYGGLQVGDSFYFSGHSSQGRCALWKTDGTSIGTISLRDFNPVVGQSCPNNLTRLGDTLFFTASDEFYGDELWRSDGTAAGTVMVKDIETYLEYGSTPRSLVAVKDNLYFVAEQYGIGRELWISNGTTDGTHVIKDIVPGSSDANISSMKAYNNNLFFMASNSMSSDCQKGIWISDGTVEGTKVFSDCRTVDSENKKTIPLAWFQPTEIGGLMYFIVEDIESRGLWKSDGSELGTVQVGSRVTLPMNGATFAAGENYSSIHNSLVFPDGKFLMRAEDEAHGLELWISDGTEQGTHMVKDINPGKMSGYSW